MCDSHQNAGTGQEAGALSSPGQSLTLEAHSLRRTAANARQV